jgi:hypothetical protein
MLITKEGRDCRRLVPHDVNVNVVTKVTKRSACNVRAHVRNAYHATRLLYSMSAVSLAYPLFGVLSRSIHVIVVHVFLGSVLVDMFPDSVGYGSEIRDSTTSTIILPYKF